MKQSFTCHAGTYRESVLEADLRPVDSILCEGATFGRKSLEGLSTSVPLGQYRKLAHSMAHAATATNQQCAMQKYPELLETGRASQPTTAQVALWKLAVAPDHHPRSSLNKTCGKGFHQLFAAGTSTNR